MKLPLILILSILFIYNLAISQKDCQKKISRDKDEYSGDLSISSSIIQIMDPTGKHLLNELVDNNDKVADWALLLEFMYMDSSLLLSLYHNSLGHPSPVDEIDIKFTDSTSITLEKSFVGDRIQIDAYNTLIITYMSLTLDQLALFSTKKIAKFRVLFSNLSREPIMEKKMSEKTAEAIHSNAACLTTFLPDPLHLKPPLTYRNTAAPKSAPVPEPSNISSQLNRKWRLVAIFNTADGSPMDLTEAIEMQFREDATFEEQITLSDGKSESQSGVFKLLNGDKVILFTLPDNKTFSWVISRLTDSELEIKNSKYTSLYLTE